MTALRELVESALTDEVLRHLYMEADESALGNFWPLFRTGILSALEAEQAKHAEADLLPGLREALKICDDYGRDPDLHKTYPAETADELGARIKERIAALSGTTNAERQELIDKAVGTRNSAAPDGTSPAAAPDSEPARDAATPRTDAFVLAHLPTKPDPDGLNPYMVCAADLADFARTLERENAELRQRMDEALGQAIEKVKFIGVKSGIAPEIYGAMCHSIAELKGGGK